MTIIAQVIKVVATENVKLSLITILNDALGLELKHGHEVKKGDILTILLSNFYGYKSYFAEYKDLEVLTNTSNVAIELEAEEEEEVDSDDSTLNPNVPARPKGRPKTK